MKKYVYHGSPTSGLKVLEPKEAGYGKKYVYATEKFIYAVIFANRSGRNSLQATWGQEKKFYFCEEVEGVFDKWYGNKSASIYCLDKSLFNKIPELSSHEMVSEVAVPVEKEIKIKDIKEFFLEQEKKGKMDIIYYKDRRKMFPNDNHKIEMLISGLKKYGFEKTLERIRTLRPDLERPFLERYNQLKNLEKSSSTENDSKDSNK
ncbi:MAG: hypothetical protein ACPLZ9_04490 [Candidatus Ratteibacteria bacterium]